MSAETPQYASGNAMWTAVTARAKTAAKATGRPSSALIREFVYERLLARVFSDPGSPWVLKGGTALLARVDDARHSKDVDLLHRLEDISDALGQLRAAVAQDLGDHFAFEIVSVEELDHADQPGVAGCRVNIDPIVGTKSRGRFHIDLVTGSLMTAEPESFPASGVVAVPGLTAPTLRLYPVVDHVADKLCATEAYYNGRASGRDRDLVDLVVIARTQTMGLHALRVAIRGERAKRGLPPRTAFEVPADWSKRWARQAASTRICAGLDFAQAIAIAGALLLPALTNEIPDGVWDPAATAWIC